MQFCELLQDYRQARNLIAPAGMTETSVKGAHLFWADENTPRAPLFYKPGIAIIGQGYKIGYLKDRHFRYDADNYLTVTMPCPAECESFAAASGPLLGLFVDLPLAQLHAIASCVGQYFSPEHFPQRHASHRIEPARLDARMRETAKRLALCLRSDMEAEVLGSNQIGELIYQALLGENGKALFDLTQNGSVTARISKAMSYIHSNYAEPIKVQQLSRIAGMSVSGFHRDFKVIVGQSPSKYVKLIRLDKAKALLTQSSLTAKTASSSVGYASAAQFSRDFVKVYGTTPAKVRS